MLTGGNAHAQGSLETQRLGMYLFDVILALKHVKYRRYVPDREGDCACAAKLGWALCSPASSSRCLEWPSWPCSARTDGSKAVRMRSTPAALPSWPLRGLSPGRARGWECSPRCRSKSQCLSDLEIPWMSKT